MKDLIIIGAGPIGLACGIEATKAGLDYSIIEKGVLVNSIYHYPDNMTFFSTSEKLEIGGVPFVSNNPKPRKQEALEYYRRVTEKFQLNVQLYESIQSLEKLEDGFSIETSKGNYRSRYVILATGFYDLPRLLNVPGENLPKVMHYYSDPHPYYRQKVAVIGAQNSAVDVALECWRKGAEVSMIVRGEGIANRVKYWVRPDIENRIQEGSINAFFNAEVQEITKDKIIFKHEGEVKELDNDFVLAMTGYRPNFEFIQKLGVQLNKEDQMKPVYDPETMESNVEGLYLVGVIVGGMETAKWFIENSRVHAQIAVENMVSKLV